MARYVRAYQDFANQAARVNFQPSRYQLPVVLTRVSQRYVWLDSLPRSVVYALQATGAQ